LIVGVIRVFLDLNLLKLSLGDIDLLNLRLVLLLLFSTLGFLSLFFLLDNHVLHALAELSLEIVLFAMGFHNDLEVTGGLLELALRLESMSTSIQSFLVGVVQVVNDKCSVRDNT